MLELITDRTQSDIANKTKKGYYNAEDLNRVSSAMEYLVAELQKYGYNTPGYSRVYIDRSPSSRLPEGYTELEYIESTGTQYIDTGFKPNQNTTVVVSTDISSSETSGVFGCRDAVNVNAFIFWVLDTSQIRSDYGTSALKLDVDNITGFSLINQSKNSCFFNDYEITHPQQTFEAQYPLLIFTTSTAGVVDTRKVSGKIYYFKLYNNDELYIDFVPCTNPSGEAGLYDLVHGVFYANSGTGAFTSGPEVQNPGDTSLDPYTWYEDDIPTKPQMEQYRSNVASIRAVLEVLDTTPETPDSMEKLTYQKANDFEKILVDVETVIEQIVKGMARSDCFTFWSGNRPIPCASSNLGRTWEELDARNVPWENLENVDWYLLAYGNLGVSQ